MLRRHFSLKQMGGKLKTIKLPVLRSRETVYTAIYTLLVGHSHIKNRFGIAEPCPRFAAQRRNRLPAWALDTLIVPLVGFDQHANRMGMGGGFYDRSLAFMRRPGPAPTLIGVAHSCQQVDTLPVEPWDINLSACVTDQSIFIF